MALPTGPSVMSPVVVQDDQSSPQYGAFKGLKKRLTTKEPPNSTPPKDDPEDEEDDD